MQRQIHFSCGIFHFQNNVCQINVSRSWFVMLLPLGGGKYGQKSNDSPLSKPAVVPSNLDHGCLALVRAALNGRITESRYVFYHRVGFTLSNKAHLFSEYILWHPRGETLRLAQWGLSRPGCVDPSTGCERQRDCSPCKAMWAESVSGKLAEQIIHGLRARTKEQTNL